LLASLTKPAHARLITPASAAALVTVAVDAFWAALCLHFFVLLFVFHLM